MTMTTAPDDARSRSEIDATSAAACLFHGFGDRSRLRIVQHLMLGEHRVIDMVQHMGLAQSTVSKHLACLVDCGVATVRPTGRSSVYSLAHPEATARLFSAAEHMLALTGDAVTLCPTYGDESSSPIRVDGVGAR